MHVPTFLVAALVELHFKLLVDLLGLPFSLTSSKVALAGLCVPEDSIQFVYNN